MHEPFPLGASQPLVVPVELSSDLDREGPIAGAIARAFGAPLELVTILDSGDFLPGEFELFAEQADELAASLEVPVTLRLVVAEQLADAFFAVCKGHVICMTTSASPFKRKHYVDSFAAALIARTTHPSILIGPSVPIGDFSCDRVIAAVADDAESRAVLPVARAFAEGLRIPMQRVSLHEGTGTFYSTKYASSADCLPTEIHAVMGREPVHKKVVGDTIAARAGRQILAVSTHARQGLAWIAEGSVAFDLVAASDAPVLVVGPNLGRKPDPTIELEGETVELRASHAEAAREELDQWSAANEGPPGQLIYRPGAPPSG